MRLLQVVHGMVWNGGDRLENEGEYECKEKEREVSDSARSDPGVEGGVDGENVGCD